MLALSAFVSTVRLKNERLNSYWHVIHGSRRLTGTAPHHWRCCQKARSWTVMPLPCMHKIQNV